MTRRVRAKQREALLASHLSDAVHIVDVGARGGVDSRWERFYFVLDVLGFEPDAPECERLNLRARELPYRARFLPYALGREAGELTFNVCRWPVASSVYEPNSDFLEDFPPAAALMTVTERRRLTTVALDDVCAREALAPDCLKIDVEGAELDVLRGAAAALEHALVLDVEVEFDALFRGQPLFPEVDVYLREKGWRLLGLRRVSWRRPAGLAPVATGYGGQLISGDALYFNDRAIKGGLTRARTLKLALILSAYRQHDFARALFRQAPLTEVPAGERSLLEAYLTPPPSAAWRLGTRALRQLSSEQRRRIADALQHGEAPVWEDAHHF